MINRRGVERTFDQAEILKVFNIRALEDQLERNATRSAAKTVRAVLNQHYVGSTITYNTHRTRQAFEYDHRLNQRALVACWYPVRTTRRQLEQKPEEVLATVLALMDR